MQGTLGGIVSLAWVQLDSLYALYGDGPGQEIFNDVGLVPWEFAVPSTLEKGVQCPSFIDPLPTMMRQLNTMMVRAGGLAAVMEPQNWDTSEPAMDPGLSMHTTLTGYQEGDVCIATQKARTCAETSTHFDLAQRLPHDIRLLCSCRDR